MLCDGVVVGCDVVWHHGMVWYDGIWCNVTEGWDVIWCGVVGGYNMLWRTGQEMTWLNWIEHG